MKSAVLLSVILGACATGEPIGQVEAPRARPTQDAQKVPHRRTAAEFPSARRIAPRLLVEGPMTAAVDLCVRPNGDTALVRLRESSGDRNFDRAILEDVQQWKYEPSDHVSCEQATINYVP
jgi:TonB family protein